MTLTSVYVLKKLHCDQSLSQSDTKERIALIQRFISIFGKDRIVNVFPVTIGYR